MGCGIKLPEFFAERVHFRTRLDPCYLRFHLRFLSSDIFPKGVGGRTYDDVA